MLLNKFSFICFGDSPPEPEDLELFPVAGETRPTSASVIICPGETYACYIPAITEIDFTSGTLALVNAKTLVSVIANVGELTDVAVPNQVLHYIANFIIPSNANLLTEGYYRLQATTVEGAIYSNRLLLRPNGADDESCIFTFANIDPIGPIAYDLAQLLTFANILRLKCSSTVSTSQTNVESYEQQATGPIRTVEVKTFRYISFSAPHVDRFGEIGWPVLLAHKILQVNGQPLTLKTGYTTESDKSSGLSSGSFELWDDKFSIINRC